MQVHSTIFTKKIEQGIKPTHIYYDKVLDKYFRITLLKTNGNIATYEFQELESSDKAIKNENIPGIDFPYYNKKDLVEPIIK
jgi:hypothetical protein